MNEIDHISIIKRQNLDECNYLKSILDEGLNNNLITEDDILDFQVQLLELLDERVYRYNGLYSSSIPVEKMEEISTSNIYTIGLFLKTFRNPDEALKTLKEESISYAYEEGRKQIDKLLNIIRVMYIKVKQNMLTTKNYTYNATIVGGIKGFLKKYNPDFKAQDMIITADYPTFNNLIGKLEGVEFIKEYLYSLYLENEFCKNFSSDKINYLLLSYENDYKDLIINLFEIVLLEAVGCKIIKRNIQDLIISKDELEKIYALFQDEKNIENCVNEAYQEIKKEIIKDNIDLSSYIEKNLDYIVKVIKNAVSNKNLEKVFITQKFI